MNFGPFIPIRNDQGNVNKTFRYPALVMTDAEDIERWRIAHIFSDASVVFTYSWILYFYCLVSVE